MGSDKVHVNIALVGSGYERYVPLMEKRKFSALLVILYLGKKQKKTFESCTCHQPTKTFRQCSGEEANKLKRCSEMLLLTCFSGLRRNKPGRMHIISTSGRLIRLCPFIARQSLTIWLNVTITDIT